MVVVGYLYVTLGAYVNTLKTMVGFFSSYPLIKIVVKLIGL